MAHRTAREVFFIAGFFVGSVTTWLLYAPDEAVVASPMVAPTLAPALPGVAANEQGVTPVIGDQQIATATLATATALTVPTTARFALIQAEGGNLRWRESGDGDPTATVGQLIVAGDSLWYDGALKQIKLIRTAAGAAANVTYYQ